MEYLHFTDKQKEELFNISKEVSYEEFEYHLKISNSSIRTFIEYNNYIILGIWNNKFWFKTKNLDISK